MTSRADTGHAVQAAARLEHLLLMLILTHLDEPKLSKRRAKKMLDRFDKRRREAHTLGLIDDATNSDLRTINDVRVVFAHAEEPIRFASAPVRIKARRFRDWKPRASARRLFDEAVARAKTVIIARTDALRYERAL